MAVLVLGFPLNTFLDKWEKSGVGTVYLDLFCEEFLECDMKLSDSLNLIYSYPMHISQIKSVGVNSFTEYPLIFKEYTS